MKTDVANVQLSQTRKVSYGEFALISVVLLTASKFCSLPSVLAGAAESKAIWVVALLSVIESVTLFFGTKIAKSGGLFKLDLKRPPLVFAAILYLVFWALKLAALTREISSYYALSLFENVPVLPVAAICLIACALLSAKGFAAIGRVLEIFMWLFVFVFLFIIVFTTTTGDAFNALAMFNPDFRGFGKGVWFGFAWFGDAAVVCFLDLSGVNEPSARGMADDRTTRGRKEEAKPSDDSETSASKKTETEECGNKSLPTEKTQGGEDPPGKIEHKKRVAFAAIFFSLGLLLAFYAVFLSIYGNAAKMTDFAFIKLSAFKANTDELGSADWPVILLWAIVGVVYLALLFAAGEECLSFLKARSETRQKKTLPFLFLGAFALLFPTIFLDEEGDYTAFMTKYMNAAAVVISVLTVALGIFALVKHKEKKNETAN